MRNGSTVFGRRSGWEPTHKGGQGCGVPEAAEASFVRWNGRHLKLKQEFEPQWNNAPHSPGNPKTTSSADPTQYHRLSSSGNRGTTRRRPAHSIGTCNRATLTRPTLNRTLSRSDGQPTAWAGRSVVLSPGTPWLDGTCHFPSPGLRGDVISFFKNPNPLVLLLSGDSPLPRQRPFAGLGVGHQEVWHEHHEHHDFFMASQHPTLFLFFFMLPFFPMGSQVL